MKILFVTWDGPQVTYLESLFLPIFVRLAEHGISFQILQFTWADSERIALARQGCEKAGVGYQAIPIWRRPRAMGAMLTAIAGARHVKKAVKEHRIDAVMARSTLPALASMLALRGTQCPLVFDADGLPLDERVDFAGQSPSGLMHRLLRDVEAQAVRRADVVLTRSAKAIEILHARAGASTPLEKFHLVSNGRDANLFKPADATERVEMRRTLGLAADAPLVIYAGSLGPQYCIDEMLCLFSYIKIRRQDAHLLILTGSPDAMQPALAKHPQVDGSVTVLTVSARDVSKYLGCSDLGLALRQPSFSMQAVAPIKLGEYLLCGLPVAATACIGDTQAISADAGVLLQRMDAVELKSAADWFVDSVIPQRELFRSKSRAVGLAHFSLEASAASYKSALQNFNISL